MYLDKMTREEILRKYYEDENEIHIRGYNVISKLKKLDTFRKIYPYNKVYEIKCKSGNRYCLIIFIEGKIIFNKSGYIDNVRFFRIPLFTDNAGHTCAYSLIRSIGGYSPITKLSYHFLKRYNERRGLHCTNMIDIISSFFIDECMFVRMPEYVNENHKDTIMLSSEYGGIFAEIDDDIVVFKTFIDSESMTNHKMKRCDETYEKKIDDYFSSILYCSDEFKSSLNLPHKYEKLL